MPEADLKSLLDHMPEIAKAVNAFTSEVTQRDALAALLQAYAGTAVSPSARAPDVAENTPRDEPAPELVSTPTKQTDASPAARKPRKANGSAKSEGFKLVKDLDLHPAGKQSFEEFAQEKQPKSNEDKYAVAVYWLQHVADISQVTPDHVGTVFRFTSGWREPGDVAAGMRMTSSRKGTIDTAKAEDIRTTPRGRNFVEHDLPAPEKAKIKK